MKEKDEKEKVSHLIDTIIAEKDILISESHKMALTVEGDDVDTVETRLTKNEALPKAKRASIPDDQMSVLTGEIRESKAKDYTAEKAKKVSLQYVNTINQINGEHDDKYQIYNLNWMLHYFNFHHQRKLTNQKVSGITMKTVRMK